MSRSDNRKKSSSFAIQSAIDILNGKSVPDDSRKLIIVISDGIDASGADKKPFQELGKRANLAGIVINTVGYNAFQPGSLRNLYELSKQTGGVDRNCKAAQDVGLQISNNADELRKQYVALFQSPLKGDSKDHGVQVDTEASGQLIPSEVVDKTLVICLPGKPGGAVECLGFVVGAIPHCVEVLQEVPTSC